MSQTLIELFRKNHPESSLPIAGFFKNKVFFLGGAIPEEAKGSEGQMEWITLKDQIGRDIYRRSLAFLLRKTVSDLFSNARLAIGHSLQGGYYFSLFIDTPVSEPLLEEIKFHLLELVQKNIPFEKIRLPREEAIEIFRSRGCPDKVRLIQNLDKPVISLYRLADFYDLNLGVMVLETSQLKVFDLITRSPGFILRFPRKEEATLSPILFEDKLFQVYRESQEWGNVLEVNNLGRLNQKINDGSIYEFIQVVEAFHERKIVRIADEIASKKREFRLILISGPSSSGKTTFAKRLGLQLKVLGVKPKTISLDNYFTQRTHCPKDETGDFDFEHIDALDRPLLNQHLAEILSGMEVQCPLYDFESGTRKTKTVPFRLGPDEILVVEGIHALNPKLTYSIAESLKFMIYISCLSQITIDEGNRISTTSTRLLRRILRDQKFRYYSAEATISRWPSVHRGENLNIFPYQENAHTMINSALIYEIPVLKHLVSPLLMEIPRESKAFLQGQRLLKILDFVLPLNSIETIPPTSILREFIGGSSFDY